MALAHSMYAGGVVKNLGAEKLSAIAKKVSGELKEHQFTMLQYSSDELLESIHTGRAACTLSAEKELVAFAQFWPYQVESDGDEFLDGEKVFEIGSWLSFDQHGGGQGRKVFESCLAVGKMQHPKARFVAIVEEGNHRAAGILEILDGKEIGKKNTGHIKKANDSKAEMIIYQMHPKLSLSDV